MKKNIYLLLIITLGFVLIPLEKAFCQFERIEISYSIEEISTEESSSFELSIKTLNASGNVNFALYNERPLPENLKSESGFISSDNYTFSDLESGKYYVIVTENNDKVGFETIIIGNSKTSQQ